MYYAGLDVANKSSFLYVVDRRGKKTESKEIPTDKDGIRQYFRQWKDKGIEVAVEAGGQSALPEWRRHPLLVWVKRLSCYRH